MFSSNCTCSASYYAIRKLSLICNALFMKCEKISDSHEFSEMGKKCFGLAQSDV
jgi:hypothetical protein